MWYEKEKKNLQKVVKWGKRISPFGQQYLYFLPHPKPLDSFFIDLRKPSLLCLTSPTESFHVYLDSSQVFPHKHKCEITQISPPDASF